MTIHPHHYVPTPVVTVQCPRCGQSQDVRHVERSLGFVEYAGVCGTPIADAGYCSTTLRVIAQSHVFASTGV
jgi:hypothetical protein